MSDKQQTLDSSRIEDVIGRLGFVTEDLSSALELIEDLSVENALLRAQHEAHECRVRSLWKSLEEARESHYIRELSTTDIRTLGKTGLVAWISLTQSNPSATPEAVFERVVQVMVAGINEILSARGGKWDGKPKSIQAAEVGVPIDCPTKESNGGNA